MPTVDLPAGISFVLFSFPKRRFCSQGSGPEGQRTLSAPLSFFNRVAAGKSCQRAYPVEQCCNCRQLHLFLGVLPLHRCRQPRGESLYHLLFDPDLMVRCGQQKTLTKFGQLLVFCRDNSHIRLFQQRTSGTAAILKTGKNRGELLQITPLQLEPTLGLFNKTGRVRAVRQRLSELNTCDQHRDQQW